MALEVKVTGTAHRIGNDLVEQTMHKKPLLGGNGAPGAVTYTERLLDFSPMQTPFINPEHGAAINIDASSGGTPQGVHDGIDSVLWTGSNITGSKVTFDSGARPLAGSVSVKVDNPALNNTWAFDKGSSVTAGSYVALSLKINIDKDWSGNDEIQVYAYDTGTALDVGGRVNLSDYCNETDFDAWQSVTIPFSDLGIASLAFDSIRMTQSGKSGKAAKLYIDTMQLEEAGEPLEWRVVAPGNQAFYVHRLRFSFAGALAGTVANGTMHGLAYDQLLGLASLTNGIVMKRVVDGGVDFSITHHNLGDFLASGAVLTNTVSDGTDTMITLDVTFEYPIILYANESINYLSLTISDDLSGLLYGKVMAIGGEIKL